jgi:hypothetical protein
MEAKVKECLDTIGEALKKLILTASNEAEIIGLFAMVGNGLTTTYEKAIEEGINELEKREEEEKADVIE